VGLKQARRGGSNLPEEYRDLIAGFQRDEPSHVDSEVRDVGDDVICRFA